MVMRNLCAFCALSVGMMLFVFLWMILDYITMGF